MSWSATCFASERSTFIPGFYTATIVAGIVVLFELLIIAWIQWRYMDTPPVSAGGKVMLGGGLVLEQLDGKTMAIPTVLAPTPANGRAERLLPVHEADCRHLR